MSALQSDRIESRLVSQGLSLAHYSLGDALDNDGLPAWHYPARLMLRLREGAGTSERTAALLLPVLGLHSPTDLRMMGYGSEAIQMARWAYHARELSSIEWLATQGPRPAARIKLAELVEQLTVPRGSAGRISDDTREFNLLARALLRRGLGQDASGIIEGPMSTEWVDQELRAYL